MIATKKTQAFNLVLAGFVAILTACSNGGSGGGGGAPVSPLSPEQKKVFVEVMGSMKSIQTATDRKDSGLGGQIQQKCLISQTMPQTPNNVYPNTVSFSLQISEKSGCPIAYSSSGTTRFDSQFTFDGVFNQSYTTIDPEVLKTFAISSFQTKIQAKSNHTVAGSSESISVQFNAGGVIQSTRHGVIEISGSGYGQGSNASGEVISSGEQIVTLKFSTFMAVLKQTLQGRGQTMTYAYFLNNVEISANEYYAYIYSLTKDSGSNTFAMIPSSGSVSSDPIHFLTRAN